MSKWREAHSHPSLVDVAADAVGRPGYGKANPNNKASIEYNKNICIQTTRWAMVEWLQDEHRNGIWGVSPKRATSPSLKAR